MAGPIVIKITDLANGPPEVEVDGAPNGYNFCTCADLGFMDPSNEDGGVITLFGVDTYGSINEPGACGVALPGPTLPRPTCVSAVDIVWIQHDYYGLSIMATSKSHLIARFQGHYYRNPPSVLTGCPGP